MSTSLSALPRRLGCLANNAQYVDYYGKMGLCNEGLGRTIWKYIERRRCGVWGGFGGQEAAHRGGEGAAQLTRVTRCRVRRPAAGCCL